jgi:hypothetical protein
MQRPDMQAEGSFKSRFFFFLSPPLSLPRKKGDTRWREREKKKKKKREKRAPVTRMQTCRLHLGEFGWDPELEIHTGFRDSSTTKQTPTLSPTKIPGILQRVLLIMKQVPFSSLPVRNWGHVLVEMAGSHPVTPTTSQPSTNTMERGLENTNVVAKKCKHGNYFLFIKVF